MFAQCMQGGEHKDEVGSQPGCIRRRGRDTGSVQHGNRYADSVWWQHVGGFSSEWHISDTGAVIHCHRHPHCIVVRRGTSRVVNN